MPDAFPVPDTRPKRPRAVRPSHAASLLVLRPGTQGPEVLMGLRGARHRFMPNRLVFPGGRVDRADYRARVASPLRPEVLRRLEKVSNSRLALALAIAASRELEEETGLSLGRPPHLDGIDYLCRAVTPARSAIRFDARFLVVEAAHVSGSLAGSGELEGLRYYDPQEALALDLATATRGVLEQLLEYLALPEAERRARTVTKVLRNRTWEIE
ncbi:MAG: NUDIX hydrolase [Acidisphaera sp.]|nr:NUDIX hydrolase [Acidisphaera sp.]